MSGAMDWAKILVPVIASGIAIFTGGTGSIVALGIGGILLAVAVFFIAKKYKAWKRDVAEQQSGQQSAEDQTSVIVKNQSQAKDDAATVGQSMSDKEKAKQKLKDN